MACSWLLVGAAVGRDVPEQVALGKEPRGMVPARVQLRALAIGVVGLALKGLNLLVVQGNVFKAVVIDGAIRC